MIVPRRTIRIMEASSGLYEPRQDSCNVGVKRITVLVGGVSLCDGEADVDDRDDFFDHMPDHQQIVSFLVPRICGFHAGHG